MRQTLTNVLSEPTRCNCKLSQQHLNCLVLARLLLKPRRSLVTQLNHPTTQIHKPWLPSLEQGNRKTGVAPEEAKNRKKKKKIERHDDIQGLAGGLAPASLQPYLDLLALVRLSVSSTHSSAQTKSQMYIAPRLPAGVAP